MTYNKEQSEYECKDLLMTIIDDTKTSNKNYIIHTHICAYPFVFALLLLNYWSIRKRKRGPNWFGRTSEVIMNHWAINESNDGGALKSPPPLPTYMAVSLKSQHVHTPRLLTTC